MFQNDKSTEESPTENVWFGSICNVQMFNIKLIMMLLFLWVVGAKESGAQGKPADVHGFGGAGHLDPDTGNIAGTKTRNLP